MKVNLLVSFICLAAFACKSEKADERISTLDFVQIVDDNRAEALYYYQNNWIELRKKAKKTGIIHSYQLLETQPAEDPSFHFILITTYGNKNQYELREDNFGELIDQRGDVSLMNEKQPGEFRKIIFSKNVIKHWGD